MLNGVNVEIRSAAEYSTAYVCSFVSGGGKSQFKERVSGHEMHNIAEPLMTVAPYGNAKSLKKKLAGFLVWPY